jgi:hypothetical protein
MLKRTGNCFWLPGVALLIVLSCDPVLGQQTAKPTPTPERPRAIVSLLNEARLAAPELAVDTLLKVVESKKATDPVWRKEILDEAWRMADDVRYPVQKERAYFGTDIVDTVSGYMTYAYELKLDRLSLQSRIIKNILTDDKQRARQMLFQIGGDLKLKPVGCEDSMSYVVDDIYATVGAVAKTAFTPKEISEGVRALFVLAWIENIQSPSQIMPVFELLNGLQGPASERQMLINAFERSVNRNFADDRSFSRAFYREPYRALSFIRSLGAAAENYSFAGAWRDFLIKNSAGPRCLDSKPAKKDILPAPVNSFNLMFAEEKRFTPEDFAEVEYRGVPKDKLYIESPTYKKISLLFKTAREAKNRPENKEDKAAQLEWQLKVSETLEALDSWKSSADESEAEVFNQKTVFYRVMLPEVDDPQMRMTVARAFMRYLAGSAMQKESFIEWLYHAKGLAAKQPELFTELASEFPNPNFNVMVAVKKGGL